MKALVTGGGGFLGLYITEQLVARGEDVRVFCRGDYPRLGELGVEVQRGDVRDSAAVAAACAGMDVVFHTAAIPGVWGPWPQYYEINTLGTEHVIAGCQQHGVPKLVYTSSPSVVFGSTSHEDADESLPYPSEYACHYPHTKALAEQAVLAANGQRGLATCALRPHLIWGPRDNHLIPRLIQRARSGRLRRVGDGSNLVSMTYVENTAHAHLQAADALNADSAVAGQAYFINEPEPVNLWQWIDQLLALVDLPPVKRSVSTKTALRIGGALETVYRLLHLPGEPPMTRFLAAQLSCSHYYSVEKSRRDFGYAPQVTFPEAMQRLQRDLAAGA
ncbi:3 beta-hydroxysteroid dehydrogenase/Delta 5--_4-isomerase [Symmachiella macrocystis]|uniref:3 beta-hydroxysteroid dehydrogenase/Delta 5-->4-isomerase n=1 Tax=Symmachiella macrocystis TaxID=2527985 RepID=A0A5C6B2Z0_9PLAN|nr:NAD-dependent epimerase/dehydratase family protein [Symmachiella macrocystis]TWU06685.1 3 beta-hydroxysteroid dehydrogenase/Delta 5-->4-isomerase [Symmachiella macrocystis]